MEKFNKTVEELKGNNNNPFSVPKGYFEDFPTKMQERIISDNKEYAWAIKLFRFIKPQFALGFIIIAFAVIAITTINFILSNRHDSGIDTDLYTRIIEVDASEFSEQHFIDVLLEDKKKIDDHEQEESDFYIHYLVDENIDYGTLINELKK